MTTSPNVTLAELAIRIPAASRVFRRHGLDYCCSGHRALADACRAKDIDPSAVLEELERESTAASADLPRSRAGRRTRSSTTSSAAITSR